MKKCKMPIDKDLNKLIDFKDRLKNLSKEVNKIIEEMKFDFFYSKERELFCHWL